MAAAAEALRFTWSRDTSASVASIAMQRSVRLSEIIPCRLRRPPCRASLMLKPAYAVCKQGSSGVRLPIIDGIPILRINDESSVLCVEDSLEAANDVYSRAIKGAISS